MNYFYVFDVTVAGTDEPEQNDPFTKVLGGKKSQQLPFFSISPFSISFSSLSSKDHHFQPSMSCEQILFPDSKFDNKKDNFLEDNFLKMGHSRPLFHLFSSFLNYNETFINVTEFYYYPKLCF